MMRMDNEVLRRAAAAGVAAMVSIGIPMAGDQGHDPARASRLRAALAGKPAPDEQVGAESDQPVLLTDPTLSNELAADGYRGIVQATFRTMTMLEHFAALAQNAQVTPGAILHSVPLLAGEPNPIHLPGRRSPRMTVRFVARDGTEHVMAAPLSDDGSIGFDALLQRIWAQRGVRFSSDLRLDLIEAWSMSDALRKAGFVLGPARAGASHEVEEARHTVVIQLREEYFRISLDEWSEPLDLIGAGQSEADFAETVRRLRACESQPVVVDEVIFGWSLIAVVQTSAKGQALRTGISVALEAARKQEGDGAKASADGRLGVRLSAEQREAVENCTIKLIAIGANPDAAPPTALEGVEGIRKLCDYIRDARPAMREAGDARLPMCKPMSFVTRFLQDGRCFRVEAESVFRARRQMRAPFEWRASIVSAHIVDNEDNDPVWSSLGEWMVGLRHGENISLEEIRNVPNGARLTDLVSTPWFASHDRHPTLQVRIGEQDHNRTRWTDYPKWEARGEWFPHVDAARGGTETLRVNAGGGVNAFVLRIETRQPQFSVPVIRGPGDLIGDRTGR